MPCFGRTLITIEKLENDFKSNTFVDKTFLSKNNKDKQFNTIGNLKIFMLIH